MRLLNSTVASPRTIRGMARGWTLLGLLLIPIAVAAQSGSGDNETESGAGNNGGLLQPMSGGSDDYGLHEKHIERLTEAQKVAPVGVDGFGDRISYFTGGLSFNNVDISLPGNSGLPVELRRSFAIEDRRELTAGPNPKGHLGGFAEWSLDIPHLSATFKQGTGWQVAGTSPTQRCSTTSAPISYPTFAEYDYWNGYNLNIPGAGSEPLLRNPSAVIFPSGTSYPWATRSFWRISCKSSTANGYGGQAFIATAPDGTKYHLDHVITRAATSIKAGGYPSSVPVFSTMSRETVYFLVTKVEDRFGNYVSYTYTGDKLTKIKAYNSAGVADGREITLTWAGDKIDYAAAPTGTWDYAYSTDNRLTSVTQPDNSQWTYTKTGKLFMRMVEPLEPGDDPFNDCPENSSPGGDTIVYAVKHPAGATATFTLYPERHYRSNVPNICRKPSTTYEYLQIPNYSDTFTLASKVITGPGLSAMTWNYSYQGGHGLAFASACGTPGSIACPSIRKVTIQGSYSGNENPTWEQHEYGILYGINEGQLLKKTVGPSSTTALRTTTNTYITAGEVTSHPFPDLIGLNPLQYADQLADSMRPLKKRVIAQQGVNFTRETTSFDKFGNSLLDSTSGTQSRTEGTEYHHDDAKWVVMQPKRRLINGTETDRTTYSSSTALPTHVYKFGLLTHTYTYDVHGSLSTIKEGNSSQTTTLSNWKWGIPQSVQFAIANESITATVDNRGWVTQVTDEMGYATTYGYDAMGRVSSITYPSETPSWTPTSIEFKRNTTDPYSIGAGHWKQTVTRGAYRKETFYDGLWRPVIELEQDTGVSTSKRFKAWKHDHAGRVTFAAYPRSSATSLASFSLGTTNQYDALGRPTVSSQDTEYSGDAITQHSYLNGFKTRVRNPRLFNTDFEFQAFGEPSTDYPTKITAAVGQSEQQLTTILRNPFHGTTKLTRSGTFAGSSVSASRDYVYDAHQRLCKRVEPETGATLVDYDSAGNIAWTAEGSSLKTMVCNRTSVPTSERVLRAYDARNRLTLVNYPDATADIVTTYFKDGAVQTTSTGGVLTTYAYNKRRLLISENIQYTGINWTTSYAYSSLGDVASVTYPDGHTVSFAPNALGQPTQAGTYATGVTYHPNGAIQSFAYGNGIVHSLTLNTRQLPLKSRDAGLTTIIEDDYVYDFNGNVAAITDAVLGPADGVREMVYDGLDRLVSVDASGAYGGDGAWQYDPLDNLRVAVQGARDLRYNYNANWQLATLKNPAGTTLNTFIHDVRGNMLQRNTGDTFTFDRANRMTASSVGNGSYLYDALGRRVRRTAAGHTTNYQYSQSGQLMYAKSSSEGRLHNYIYLSGSLVAKRSVPIGGGAASTLYQHSDGLGSAVAETTSGGALSTPRELFTSYGESADGSMKEGHGYTGHQSDLASGLVYMQQRYYDPEIGIFLSPDPVQTSRHNGSSFHRFAYAANSPYVYVDPDGRHNGRVNPNPDYSSLTLEQKRVAASIVGEKYGIEMADINVSVQPGGEGAIAGAEALFIWEGEFVSESRLASTLGHEIEVHYEIQIDGRGEGYEASPEAEVEAYEYNIENAERFGNTEAEVQGFKNNLAAYQALADKEKAANEEKAD